MAFPPDVSVYIVARQCQGRLHGGEFVHSASCAVLDFPQMLALGSLGGRIGWAAFSDKFGRKLTFQIVRAVLRLGSYDLR